MINSTENISNTPNPNMNELSNFSTSGTPNPNMNDLSEFPRSGTINAITKAINGYMEYFGQTFITNMWAAIQDPAAATCEITDSWKAQIGTIAHTQKQIDLLLRYGTKKQIAILSQLHPILKDMLEPNPQNPWSTTGITTAINSLQEVIDGNPSPTTLNNAMDSFFNAVDNWPNGFANVVKTSKLPELLKELQETT